MLKKKIENLEENKILKIVNRGLKEYKTGKTKTLKSLKDLI